MANVTTTKHSQEPNKLSGDVSNSKTASSIKLNKNAPEFVPRAPATATPTATSSSQDAIASGHGVHGDGDRNVNARAHAHRHVHVHAANVADAEDTKDLEEIISVMTSSTHSNSPPSDPARLTATGWMPDSLLFPVNLSSFPTATCSTASASFSRPFSRGDHDGVPLGAPSTLSRAASSPSSTSTSKPGQNSLSKRGFYISKEKIAEMMQRAKEPFVTDQDDDEKLAFSYYKESVAMQINDGQLRERFTKYGCIVIINIDLHFAENGECMFLIARANDADFVHKVGWQIAAFMNKEEIFQIYGIDSSELPKSSRSMRALQDALCFAPKNINFYRLEIGDLTKIPKKVSKRTMAEPAVAAPSTAAESAVSVAASTVTSTTSSSANKPAISKYALRKAIQRSFKHHDAPIVPVVVIKGKRQWIEWKRFVEIRLDHSNKKEWIGVSLRYHQSNRQWKVECIDLDGGRIYYQHRLVGLADDDKNYHCYNEIMQYVTIASLHIHNNGGMNHHHSSNYNYNHGHTHSHNHVHNHNARVPFASKSMSHIPYQHRASARGRNLAHSRNGSGYSYKRKVESQDAGGALEVDFSDLLNELDRDLALSDLGGDALSALFTQDPKYSRSANLQHVSHVDDMSHNAMAKNGRNANGNRTRKYMMEKV